MTNNQPSLFDDPKPKKKPPARPPAKSRGGATLPERWNYSKDIASAVDDCESGDITRPQLASVVGRYVFALHDWEILPVARLIRDLLRKEL